MIKIENWSIVNKDPFKAPELRKQYLQGNVYGHPKHEDEKLIITSSIVKEKDGFVITCRAKESPMSSALG
jgi:hypothetical protein